MAMQAGMGLGRIILFVSAGAAGTVVLKNNKLSDLLGDLQDLVKGFERSREKGGVDGDSDLNEVLASQVRRLAMEVRQLASSRPITVLNGGSGQSGISGLIVPAATVGALGYGYMWWKGIKFSDLMYVTKRNMANAVSGMTKHLEQVSSALAAAKRHLTQRIERLDDKLDEQKEISGIIKKEVTDAHLKIVNIGTEINSIKQLVWGLDDKMNSMEDKQNFSCAGVMYLCQFIEGKGGKMPDFLQDASKLTGKRFIGCGEKDSVKGLQHLIEAFESGAMGNGADDKVPRTATVKMLL
ncbi:hypothetical protein LUZ62_046078 [Rhynchospora pubera]|uniref:DUF1664 domain-containing protein n=1 Tax=Rhynchospora pubera TaxID=906938 RepID=A0AAV8FV81_9POAL|nr:hypothetical protein LUZ62_046078 [Rhynchospora pubera]